MTNIIENATGTNNTIGTVYGKTGRLATAKEMAMAADMVGSDDAMLMVNRRTGQAWKWADHFNLWATMDGWTGYVKMVGGKWRAFC